MNTNMISPKPADRRNRIQRASVNLKTFFLFVSIIGGLAGGAQIISGLVAHPQDAKKIVTGCIQLTWTVGYWFAYKLFLAYSRGNLFNAEIVNCLRRLGCVGILIGIEENVSSFIFAAGNLPMWAGLMAMPFLFFSIIPGFAILCIAWIMDEGRKIQEEQELTV